MEKLRVRASLLNRWLRALSGKSYYHYQQGLGKVFKPGTLSGYFNDLTKKVNWKGEADEQGIPLVVLSNGEKKYFETTIVQKALGHWDMWLLSSEESHKDYFLYYMGWLLERQDGNGGWPVWAHLGLSAFSPYSAMTQGECISAFVRAWKITSNFEFLKAAEKAFQLMIKPIDNGGTAIKYGNLLFLEEAPLSKERSTILNGWIFSIFGIYDLWLATGDKIYKKYLEDSLTTLKREIKYYDSNYWSFYDVKGNLSSPFYHLLHINQLEALELIDGEGFFARFRVRWLRYYGNLFKKSMALIIKGLQRLKNPGELVIVR
ncbi:MAG: D-glucuronyl C5-epimerase family protein [Nitrososphaeria archaeon]